MLDLKFIRENVELVRTAIRNKNEKVDFELLLTADQKRREILRQVEDLKRQRNEASDQIAQLKKAGQLADEKINQMRAVSDQIKVLDEELRQVEETIYQVQIRIPNVPHVSVPVGRDASFNQEVKRWGEPLKFDFQPKPHWELAENLKIVDFDRGSKVAGSFFISYRGLGAKLERSLINFMLDLHIEKHGYTEVFPPFLTRRESMFGTGQLPKLEEDMYRIEQDDLFLIPTAEVPVTNLHRDEIIKEKELPIYYTAYTPCFRREAGTYGRDTRGLVRIHQFDKVEMVKFVQPENSYDELESLLGNAEDVLQALNLHYRVLALSTGDLSFSAAKCYDIEVWAPGVNKYLEVSSCSNFEDFQARRANIRLRRDKTNKVEYLHTLNGSGLALPRTVIAIMENFQTDECTIVIPEPLRRYMGVDIIKL